MMISNVGYNPIAKTNQNNQNKQQSAPAFKGTIKGELASGFTGEATRNRLMLIMEHIANSLSSNEHYKMLKKCTVMPPEVSKGDEKTITLRFGNNPQLNAFARKLVNREQDTLPPGVTLKFDSSQHSDYPDENLDIFQRLLSKIGL